MFWANRKSGTLGTNPGPDDVERDEAGGDADTDLLAALGDRLRQVADHGSGQILGRAAEEVLLPIADRPAGASHVQLLPFMGGRSVAIDQGLRRRGGSLPSIISSEAPPPVEMWSMRSATPESWIAATLSPPPTTV